MSAVPAVSVVVATHNRSERLERLLGGLRAQSLPRDRFEVIVVDDCSSDGTNAVLEREQARSELRLSVLRQPESKGPASARNRGWRQAEGPVIAFTDDDCIPTPGWLEALLAAAGHSPDPIVRGQTLPDPSEAHALSAYAKTMEITRPSPHYETCNVAYPRALLERVGGFDESYPSPVGEDSDLGWRAVAAGGSPMFAPDAVVHHAVFERRPLAALSEALRATEGVRAYKVNPDQRRYLFAHLFYDRSHVLLAAAVGGALLARRGPAALLLGAPYLRHLRYRCRAAHAPLRQAPFLAAYDVVQVAATLRGAARYRVLVL